MLAAYFGFLILADLILLFVLWFFVVVWLFGGTLTVKISLVMWFCFFVVVWYLTCVCCFVLFGYFVVWGLGCLFAVLFVFTAASCVLLCLQLALLFVVVRFVAVFSIYVCVVCWLLVDLFVFMIGFVG